MATSRGATASDGPEDQDQPPRLRRHAAAAEYRRQSGVRIRIFFAKVGFRASYLQRKEIFRILLNEYFR